LDAVEWPDGPVEIIKTGLSQAKQKIEFILMDSFLYKMSILKKMDAFKP